MDVNICYVIALILLLVAVYIYTSQSSEKLVDKAVRADAIHSYMQSRPELPEYRKFRKDLPGIVDSVDWVDLKKLYVKKGPHSRSEIQKVLS